MKCAVLMSVGRIFHVYIYLSITCYLSVSCYCCNLVCCITVGVNAGKVYVLGTTKHIPSVSILTLGNTVVLYS